MRVFKIFLNITKKLRSQPNYIFFVLVDILFIIICFPRYLYYLLRNQKIISFSWGNGEYSDSLMPLFDKLRDSNYKILF